MKLTRAASLGWLAVLAGGCSGPVENEVEGVAASSSAIVNGEPSPEEEDAVVEVTIPEASACTGTLIAPNLVVTASHCVSEYDIYGPFTCSDKGVLIPQREGAGRLGAPLPANLVEIRMGREPRGRDPDAHGIRTFNSRTVNICRGDIAVVVLDTDLSPAPRQVRLGTRTRRGELAVAVGYGQDELDFTRIRNRRGGLRVLGVGEFGEYESDGLAAPQTLLLGEGPCHGDSGGPAFSETTGALIGVYSLGSGSGCIGASVRNVFTQVAAYENLIREAAEFAGVEVVTEPPPASAGSGGSSATAGSGPSVGGGGATGGSADGRAGGDPGGDSGSDSGSAASAGTRTGTGSGSRRDPSCTCRVDGLTADGSSAWAGLLALVASVFVRRRRR